MNLSRKVVLSIALFSFVFLSILSAQNTTRETSSQNQTVAANTDGKAANPAGQKNETTTSAAAESKDAASPIPQAEVDSIVQQFESAFVSATNKSDAKALAELYTPGATILNEAGGLAVGRETMQRVWAASFTNSGRPTIQETTRKSTAVSSNVIVTHGVLHSTPIDDSPQDTFYTKVLTLDGGQWRIAAIQYAQPNPWKVTFPATEIGKTSSQTVNLKNNGTTELKISRWFIEGRYAPNFTETNNCAAPIPPSGSCTITFTFRPLTPGSPKAYLSFWDNAATGRHQIRLVGTGQ
jgi:ketosteroid isomerase-like protein